MTRAKSTRLLKGFNPFNIFLRGVKMNFKDLQSIKLKQRDFFLIEKDGQIIMTVWLKTLEYFRESDVIINDDMRLKDVLEVDFKNNRIII